MLCRQLGFESGVFDRVPQDMEMTDNATRVPPWLSQVDCDGSEIAIAECSLGNFGDASTCDGLLGLTCNPG